MLRFKDMYSVEYRPGEDELTNYRAYRRKRLGESSKQLSCDNVDEALSVAARLQKGRAMRKNKAKVALGRARASRRFASQDVLKRRARKAAYKAAYNKITKDIPKDKLTPQRKAEIEKRLKSSAFQRRIDMMSKKLVKDVRKKEMERKRG
jgi:Iap family predicted aminopeptidase